MNRATKEDACGYWLPADGDGIYENFGEGVVYRGKDVDRFAAYENTNLEPDEIAKLQAELAQIKQKGYWVEYEGADKGFHYCSKCKRQAINYDEEREVVEVLTDFCPHCGVQMEKSDSSDR